MSVLGKKWIIRSLDRAKPILDTLLENRGLKTKKEKDEFLNIDENSDFHDPFLMHDMQKSVDRIMLAIERNERVIIFGDYDVDGLTSAAILFHALKRLNANHSVRLPNREKDGYGLSMPFIEEFKRLGIKLIITVDCGISSAKEITEAAQNDIETIITDHHQVPETPPCDAYAINHPKQAHCNYPFSELTGAGVALKLAHALFIHNLGREGAEKEIKPLIELAALGTIADIGILKGENRLIVKKGLKNLLNTSSPGLKILKELAGFSKSEDKEISTTTIGYQIAPRINAAGRIGDPYIALKLLIGENKTELHQYGKELEDLNRRRQEMTEKSFTQAVKNFLELEKKNALPYILIESHPDWHVGIIGLTASKLAERFNRPAIIMQDLGQTLVASARSIEAFDIIEAIAAHKHHLITFGGHKEAAGFTMRKSAFAKFKKEIEKFAESKLSDKELRPSLQIDCELPAEEISAGLIEDIDKLKPFGPSNSRPVFILKNVKPSFVETVGRNSDHLKFEADINGRALPVIGFRLGEFSHEARKHKSLDIACHIDFNEWNGNKKIQLELIDFKTP
ncbi:MAG: single-stranded-DNA-specific exonuclease RecJ [Candidatus Gracilibacteria bacterium]